MKAHRVIARTIALTLAAGADAVGGRTLADYAPNPAAEAARADLQKTLGFVPRFFRAFPEEALPGAWLEMKTLQLNPATALPAPIALAATWDVEASRTHGQVAAKEAALYGNLLLESPDINIARTPHNGRTFESFGEDRH